MSITNAVVAGIIYALTELLALFFFALRLLCARQERQEQQGGNPEKFYSFVSHKPANF